MRPTARVLVVSNAGSRAQTISDRLRDRGLCPRLLTIGDAALSAAAWRPDVAVVLADALPSEPWSASLADILQNLCNDKVATLVSGAGRDLRHPGGPFLEWLPADASVDEIAGKVQTLSQYGPLLKTMERELQHLHRLGEQLNRHFEEIDQEMRLAGRLQRDFLPRELPRLGAYHFAALYRPASWVSGDMYDVFRIDEHHVGLFIADAMGHGVAAGLLTMFLRQALVPKHIEGKSYRIVAPTAALERLHECLVRQKLPNAQFITAAYAVVDVRTGQVDLARAGHPYPLHVLADGTLRELRCSGSLLGFADVPTGFEPLTIQMQPGERLIFYTDGLEDTILATEQPTDDAARFTEPFLHWSRLPAGELVSMLSEHLDTQQGSLHPQDDVTMLVLERHEGT